MSERILVTGSAGQLAGKIRELSGTTNELKFIFASKDKLDITNTSELHRFFTGEKIDILINCAAYTNVDGAEEEKKNARDVNVEGLSNLIKACNKKTKIIHISSDYIFDGEKGPYSEDDPTFPINYYGKTKLESENILIGSSLDFLIIRPNVLYSDNLSKSHFLSWVVNSLSKGEEIKVVTDQVSNPTYIPDLLQVISDTILLNFSGILHVGSEDSISRYEFANKISHAFGLKKNLIIPVESKALNQKAKRPLNSSLDCSKLQTQMNMELYPVEYGIRRVNLST
mgnify:CR=1 FL=1